MKVGLLSVVSKWKTVGATADPVIKIFAMQCHARWVLDRHFEEQRSRQRERSPSRAGHQLAARNATGALFAYTGAHSLHAHVAALPGLYIDAVMLVKALEESLPVLDAHLKDVVAYNEQRIGQGRFLFGHEMVDAALGGAFVIDVSSAQPRSGADFAMQQVEQLCEHWCDLRSCHDDILQTSTGSVKMRALQHACPRPHV